MNLISRSEVSCFQLCQTKHFFQYRQAIVPIKAEAPIGLTRGTILHLGLEHYYKAKKTGEDKDVCMEVGLIAIEDEVENYPHMEREILALLPLFRSYVDLYWDEPYTILDVEGQYDQEGYGLRIDLLVYNRLTEEIELIDHKICYNFFSDREVKMNAQLPLYADTLNKLGVPVKKAMLNQIRWRPLKDDSPEKLFKRSYVPLSPVRLQNIRANHDAVSDRIRDLYEMEKKEHLEEVSFNMDKDTCGKCAYTPLCDLRLNGKDWQKASFVLYEKNSYLAGYKDSNG